MKRNVVFSVMKSSPSYPKREFEPFLDSLRKTGYDGEVVFFVNSLDRETRDYFRRMGVRMVPYSFEYPFLKDNRAILDDFSDFKSVRLNIFHLREFLPMLYLFDHRDEFDSVVIADTADVIFQRNPFVQEYDRSKVHFSLQDNRIRDSVRDSEWIERVYGRFELEKIWDQNVCCTGLVLGGVHPVLEYLKVFCSEFKKGYTIDQGNHNYLVHNGLVKNMVLFDNKGGKMLTCSGSKRSSFLVNKQKEICYRDGSVYWMVHQYDTYPEWSFMVRGVCKRSLREWVKRLPILGSFLVWLKSLYVRNYVDLS